MSNRAMKRTVDPRSRSAHDALARGLAPIEEGEDLESIDLALVPATEKTEEEEEDLPQSLSRIYLK